MPIDPVTGLVPTNQTYYTANTQGNTAQTGGTANFQQNQYTPGQQALQGQLGSTLQGMLNGSYQIPGYMTAPPEAFQAYNNAFNLYVKPGMAAQYGAGSPQIGSMQSLGNEQLAANLYQTGVGNWQNLLGMANANAFTPVGSNSANQINQNWQTESDVDGYQGDTVLGSILSKLIGRKF